MMTDTVAAVSRHDSAQMIGIYLSIATLILAVGGVILKLGILIGEHRAFREQTETRLREIREEGALREQRAITREEFTASFRGLEKMMEAWGARMADLVTLVTEALKK